MSRRIIIYGDSYTCFEEHMSLGLPALLNQMYGYEVHCFALAGSSTEYSFYKFNYHLRNNFIQSDDIIIFQTSTVGRLYFEHQISNDPASGSLFLQDEHQVPNTPKNKWYYDNKEFIKWYVINFSCQTGVLHQTSYLHALRRFADQNHNNLVIVLMNSNFYDYSIPIESSNNFLISKTELQKVSINETYGLSYYEFLKNFKYDIRVNHLTKPNLLILTESIDKAIKEKTIDHLDINIFKKNVIPQVKNIQEFNEYVKQDILFDKKYIEPK